MKAVSLILCFLFVLAVNATNKHTHFCWFDIEANSESLGTIKLGLFGDVVPKTAENFYYLCTGEKGIGIKCF